MLSDDTYQPKTPLSIDPLVTAHRFAPKLDSMVIVEAVEKANTKKISQYE